MEQSTGRINEDTEVAEEFIRGDSEGRRQESCTSERFLCSTSSLESNATVTPASNEHFMERNFEYTSKDFTASTIQVPIIGYEVMEERARFTVYKLRIEHKTTEISWVVFRRYTDFVRLCTMLKTTHPQIASLLPRRKRWFKNNFDPDFLNDRIQGLQQFINAILKNDELISHTQVQEFLCLNDTPLDTEKTDNSKAICENLSETIYHLECQLRERDADISELQKQLSKQMELNCQLQDFIRKKSDKCIKCMDDYKSMVLQPNSHFQCDNDNMNGASSSDDYGSQNNN